MTLRFHRGPPTPRSAFESPATHKSECHDNDPRPGKSQKNRQVLPVPKTAKKHWFFVSGATIAASDWNAFVDFASSNTPHIMGFRLSGSIIRANARPLAGFA